MSGAPPRKSALLWLVIVIAAIQANDLADVAAAEAQDHNPVEATWSDQAYPETEESARREEARAATRAAEEEAEGAGELLPNGEVESEAVPQSAPSKGSHDPKPSADHADSEGGGAEPHAAEGRAEGTSATGEAHAEGEAHDEGEGHAQGDGHGEGEGHAEAGEAHDQVGSHAEDSEGHGEGHGEGDSKLGEVHVEGEDHASAHEAHGAHGRSKAEMLLSRALGYTLLGAVAWIMMFFFQINSKDEDIVQATWRILYDMLSIFVAVLTFSSFKSITVDFLSEDSGHHSSSPNSWTLLVSTTRLAIFFAAVHSLLWAIRGKQAYRLWTLKAISGIGGHAVGFAAIDVFANILHMLEVRSSVIFALMNVVGLLVLFASFFWAESVFLERVTDGDHEWLEVVAETENDAACLCLGLELSMVIRKAITGEMPPLHGEPENKTAPEVWWLFSCTMMLGGLVIILARYIGKLKRRSRDVPMLLRLLEMLQLTMSMGMGWCFLFWGTWFFYEATGDKGFGLGSDMTCCMFLAMMYSVICFIAIRIVDFIADNTEDHHTVKGLRELLKVFGLVMGLGWEASFNVAIQEVANGLEGHEHSLAVWGISVCLALVVTPAWALYVLPHVIDQEELERRHLEEEGESSDSEYFGDQDVEDEYRASARKLGRRTEYYHH